MSTPLDAPPTDFLRDRSTQFRLRMAFLVGHYEVQTYQDLEDQREVDAWFLLRSPEDETQAPWLDYQIEEDRAEFVTPYRPIPGTDAFLPRSRRLPAEGLREIFDWFEETNLWEWRPPERPENVKGWRGPKYEPETPVKVWYPGDAGITWYLEVSRGGRLFRQQFRVYGAPAPTAYAFEEGAWTFPPCPQVPIFANHLLFLTNDPIIVGLTKRLLRLLPKKKPRKQVAEFDDGRGTRYELDFDRMVARKVAKNLGLGLGPWAFLPSKTQEVPMTEYDRMRFWAILLEFKSTPEGFRPTRLLDDVKDEEPGHGQQGRRWSGKVCDGKHSRHYKKGFMVPDDEKLGLRFREAFESLFVHGDACSEIDPLPQVDLPASQHVPGGVPPLPPPQRPTANIPLYEDTPEERLLRYVEEAKVRRYRNPSRVSAAFMGDVPSMVALGPRWWGEAARLGNHEAMVSVANERFGISPEEIRSSLDVRGTKLSWADELRLAALAADADGLGREYYETAYKAGCRSAALGLGFLHEYGIGVPQDPALAVAYYREFLGELGDVIDENQVFACSMLRNLYNRHQPAVRNHDERDWLDALLGVYLCKKATRSAETHMFIARSQLIQNHKAYAGALSRWIALNEKRRKDGN